MDCPTCGHEMVNLFPGDTYAIAPSVDHCPECGTVVRDYGYPRSPPETFVPRCSQTMPTKPESEEPDR